MDCVLVDDTFNSHCRSSVRLRFDSVDRLLSKLEGSTRTIKVERQNLTTFSYDDAGRLSDPAVAAKNGKPPWRVAAALNLSGVRSP